MTEIHADFEFCEHHRILDPISIGLVDERGNTYYAIFRDMPFAYIQRDPWLINNVMDKLPVRMGHNDPWDRDHPDFVHVKSTEQIRDEVRSFVLSKPQPELWGWFASHDQVIMSQLFGGVLNLPIGFPWMDDIRQEWKRAGRPPLPDPDENEHHALADAEFNQTRLWHVRRAVLSDWAGRQR